MLNTPLASVEIAPKTRKMKRVHAVVVAIAGAEAVRCPQDLREAFMAANHSHCQRGSSRLRWCAHAPAIRASSICAIDEQAPGQQPTNESSARCRLFFRTDSFISPAWRTRHRKTWQPTGRNTHSISALDVCATLGQKLQAWQASRVHSQVDRSKTLVGAVVDVQPPIQEAFQPFNVSAQSGMVQDTPFLLQLDNHTPQITRHDSTLCPQRKGIVPGHLACHTMPQTLSLADRNSSVPAALSAATLPVRAA